ncbi:MAG: aspartate/tyrosine/aromatic aminotransferase [Proteobacteria bacterium]|nr:aspartate/tyrosine/aromatic aminotransferase [Pseudomonadota bacterium]
MFETLKAEPPEGLIATMAAFAADTHPEKLDLGVGVYRDASGQTPVMAAVRAAEAAMLARQSTKAYVGAGGNRPFAAFMEELVLGAGHPARAAGRVQVLQTPGGCGALRLAADLVVRAARGTRALVSDPTWPNHVPLIGGAGLAVDSYPYYDAASGTIAFEAMLTTLDRLPAGSLVVLHGSCHNPTGADLSREQWRELAALLGRRGLVPLVDLAYQGLGEGPDADAWAVRLLAESLPELLIGASCSKSFGLYRERVGAIIVVAANAAAAQVCMGQLQMLARRMYSFPPDHGAAIVATVAGDPALRAQWTAELEAMRARIAAQRERLAAALRREFGSGRFDFIAGQRGMFSLLGLEAAAVARLRAEHHVYIAADSRVNIAGLPEPQVERLARALRAVAG